MFPAPSPNSQALLQKLQNGGATPSTMEFHRTALTAKKNAGGPTSNAPEQDTKPNMDPKAAQPSGDQFTQHDAADAANGLFMLAKGGQANNMPMNQTAMQNETRAAAARRASQHANGTGAREMSGDGSDQELAKSAGKGKGKKNAPKAAPANNRRKADDAPKGANKKMKMDSPSDMESDDEDPSLQMDPKKMTDEEKRRNFLERNR